MQNIFKIYQYVQNPFGADKVINIGHCFHNFDQVTNNGFSTKKSSILKQLVK